MWKTIWKMLLETKADTLFWSSIAIVLSVLINWWTSKSMLGKSLRHNLYKPELDNIDNLLKISFDNLAKKEPIFEERHLDTTDFENMINNLSIEDQSLKNLLKAYLSSVKDYNTEYHNNERIEDPVEKNRVCIDEKKKDEIVTRYKEILGRLRKKINRRIKKLIT